VFYKFFPKVNFTFSLYSKADSCWICVDLKITSTLTCNINSIQFTQMLRQCCIDRIMGKFLLTLALENNDH
jgi:hypothetical protein